MGIMDALTGGGKYKIGFENPITFQVGTGLVGGIGTGTSIFTKMFGTGKTVVPGASIVAKGGSIVLPLAGGALSGFGLASIFGGGGTKKDATLTAAPQSMSPIITPTNIITPVITAPNITTFNMQDYSSSIISDSPMASISKKASAASTPSWDIPFTTSQPTTFEGEQGQDLAATQSDGSNMALIAGIAAIGLIGYGYVSKRKPS